MSDEPLSNLDSSLYAGLDMSQFQAMMFDEEQNAANKNGEAGAGVMDEAPSQQGETNEDHRLMLEDPALSGLSHMGDQDYLQEDDDPSKEPSSLMREPYDGIGGNADIDADYGGSNKDPSTSSADADFEMNPEEVELFIQKKLETIEMWSHKLLQALTVHSKVTDESYAEFLRVQELELKEAERLKKLEPEIQRTINGLAGFVDMQQGSSGE